MKKFLLAKKVAMSRVFQPDGTVIPVTVLQAGPCTVTQVKNAAVQIGFGLKRTLKKPQAGHVQGLAKFRHLHDFRVQDTAGYERGAVIDVSQFAVGDTLKAIGTSKGRGFAGVVKRHGFAGSPATHGHKDQLRMPGSIGSTAPQRVFKGMRMAGRMGDARVTVRNLKVVEIHPEKNELLILGAVPGARNGLIILESLS